MDFIQGYSRDFMLEPTGEPVCGVTTRAFWFGPFETVFLVVALPAFESGVNRIQRPACGFVGELDVFRIASMAVGAFIFSVALVAGLVDVFFRRIRERMQFLLL